MFVEAFAEVMYTNTMKKVNILYIGRHLEILQTVIRLINKQDNWHAQGVLKDDEAKAIFAESNFDIVLLGCGILEQEEESLRSFFEKQQPHCRIVQHYGGGSGLLTSEILLALE